MTESIFNKPVADLKALAELRQWRSGERLDHRKLNAPVDALNRMNRGVAGARQKTFAAPPAPGQIVSVVLLSLPDGLTGMMRVRRVQYATSPPSLLPPRYAWLDEPFTAFMEFGRVRSEYDQLLSGPDIPTVDTVFLPAKFEEDIWLVDVPVTVEEKVVTVGLRSPFDADESLTMQVGRVKWRQTPPSFPEVGPPTPLDWQGQPFPALVDFGATPDDYIGLLHLSIDAPDPDIPLLIARREGAFWYLELPRSPRLTQFQVVENFGDYVSAKPFLRGIAFGSLTFIAKRWLLRRTPFDGNTIDDVLYDYTNDNERLAVKTQPDESVRRELQFITPAYLSAFSVIYATKGPRNGTGVVTQTQHGELPVGSPVEWLAEVDGREWAWDGVNRDVE